MSPTEPRMETMIEPMQPRLLEKKANTLTGIANPQRAGRESLRSIR
jgi:hypothetical protein